MIRTLAKYIGKYKGLVVLSIVLSLISVLLSLYVPVLIGNAIDFVVGQDNVALEKVLSYVGFAILVAVFVAILQWIYGIINNRVTYNVAKDVRESAFNKIQKLPLKYLDTHPEIADKKAQMRGEYFGIITQKQLFIEKASVRDNILLPFEYNKTVQVDNKTGLTSDFNQWSSPLNCLIYFDHNSL